MQIYSLRIPQALPPSLPLLFNTENLAGGVYWEMDAIWIVLYLNDTEWELLIFPAQSGVLNSEFCDRISGVPETRKMLCKMFFICTWVQLISKRVQDFHQIFNVIHISL